MIGLIIQANPAHTPARDNAYFQILRSLDGFRSDEAVTVPIDPEAIDWLDGFILQVVL